jgi:hypothetical protein
MAGGVSGIPGLRIEAWGTRNPASKFFPRGLGDQR